MLHDLVEALAQHADAAGDDLERLDHLVAARGLAGPAHDDLAALAQVGADVLERRLDVRVQLAALLVEALGGLVAVGLAVAVAVGVLLRPLDAVGLRGELLGVRVALAEAPGELRLLHGLPPDDAAHRPRVVTLRQKRSAAPAARVGGGRVPGLQGLQRPVEALQGGLERGVLVDGVPGDADVHHEDARQRLPVLRGVARLVQPEQDRALHGEPDLAGREGVALERDEQVPELPVVRGVVEEALDDPALVPVRQVDRIDRRRLAQPGVRRLVVDVVEPAPLLEVGPVDAVLQGGLALHILVVRRRDAADPHLRQRRGALTARVEILLRVVRQSLRLEPERRLAADVLSGEELRRRRIGPVLRGEDHRRLQAREREKGGQPRNPGPTAPRRSLRRRWNAAGLRSAEPRPRGRRTTGLSAAPRLRAPETRCQAPGGDFSATIR